MSRFAILAFGLVLLAVGAMKVCLNVQTGAMLTLEGCQGGTFTMELGRSGNHCWGCYVLGVGALIISTIVWRWRRHSLTLAR